MNEIQKQVLIRVADEMMDDIECELNYYFNKIMQDKKQSYIKQSDIDEYINQLNRVNYVKKILENVR